MSNRNQPLTAIDDEWDRTLGKITQVNCYTHFALDQNYITWGICILQQAGSLIKKKKVSRKQYLPLGKVEFEHIVYF